MFEVGDVIENKNTGRIRVYGWRDNELLKDPENYQKIDKTVEEVFAEGTLYCYRSDVYATKDLPQAVKTLAKNKIDRWFINGEYSERIETWKPVFGDIVYHSEYGFIAISENVDKDKYKAEIFGSHTLIEVMFKDITPIAVRFPEGLIPDDFFGKEKL